MSQEINGSAFTFIALLAVSRFMTVGLTCTYVTAILTGHMGYDTLGGAGMLMLAGITWAMGDYLVKYF